MSSSDVQKSPKKHRRRSSAIESSPERTKSNTTPPTSPNSTASLTTQSSTSSFVESTSSSSPSSPTPSSPSSARRRRSGRPSEESSGSEATSPSSSPRRRRRSSSASQSPTLTRHAVDAIVKSPKSPKSKGENNNKDVAVVVASNSSNNNSPQGSKERHARRSRRPAESIATLGADVSLIGVLVDHVDAWRLVIARALPAKDFASLALVSKRMHEIVNSREMWFERCRACFDAFSPARSAYDWRLVFDQLMHVFLTWHHTVTVYGRSTLAAAGENSLALTLTTLHDAAFHTRMWKQPNSRQYRVMLRHKSFGANVEFHFTVRWPSARHAAKFCSRNTVPPSAIVAPHDFVPNKVDTDALVVVDALDAPPGQQFCGRILS